MEILNQHYSRTVSDEFREHIAPSDSQTLNGRQRMQIAGDVDP
jgi:hypothetical protein